MEKVIHDCATEIKLTIDEAKSVCKLGEGEKCCAFLVMSAGSFECIRMSYPMNNSIFSRLKEGTMNAKYEGGGEGCPWEGQLGK